MKYFKISIGIFLVLAASRFIPHPPNFTSLIALSFYIPAIFGKKYIPVVLIVLAMTDLIIGFHSTIFFTWGSVILIAYMSAYFKINFKKRIFGIITSVFIFYLITNFGVWLVGTMYEKNLSGILLSYNFAIPFLLNSLVSTLIFALVIEGIFKIYETKKQKINFFK